jgi:hypothetical protein
MYVSLHTKYPLFLLDFNPLNAKLNPICHLLALLGAHHILHVSRIRVNKTCIFSKDFRKIMKYQILGKSVEWEPCYFTWTDMTNLIVVLRILANAFKNSEHAYQLLSISKSLDFTLVYILCLYTL